MNIMLTSVGRRSYLVKYFKDALGNKGKIHVANSSDISPAFQVADQYIVTPLIYDDNYIHFLIQYCKDNSIDAIISLFDIDLPILSMHKKDFEELGIRVIVSNPDVIEICNDKWKTYHFLLTNGFCAPQTFNNLEDAMKELHKGAINYPVIVKPRWGMGSISIFEANNDNELNVLFNKIRNDIKKTYLKFESNEDINHSVLIQEKLKGKEYGLDIISDLDGQYQTTICKEKCAMRSGETDCAVTVNSKTLKTLGSKLSEKLRHIANLDCDVFMHNEIPYVLEINARFGGGYPFSHIAGVNLPKAIIKWLSNEEIDISLLKERFNVIAQKDINLVYLNTTTNLNTVYVTEENVIFNALMMFKDMLSPSLIDRNVNIKEYTNKLYFNAKNWVIKDENDNLVGMLSAYENDYFNKTAFLSILAIAPQFRKMHLAKRLLQTAEIEAIKNGMKKFKLEVWKTNSNAIRFYYNQGYEILEDASQNSFFMIKSL